MTDTRIIKFYSKILEKEMGVSIYIPKKYAEDKKPLPVLYFLHGRSGNENTMMQLGLDKKADEMIENGKIKPMLIVCPRIENSRGINSAVKCEELKSGKTSKAIINIGRYEDYFINEVIPLIDKEFNTIKDKSGRYIDGISGGGYAALHNAFRHQDMFSKVGGHMPAIELELDEEDKPHFEKVGTWEKYDPIHIAKNCEIAKIIEVYLDAGDKDEGGFYEGCRILQEILQEKGIKSQNHLFKGHHNGEYIISNMEKYLEFYGK